MSEKIKEFWEERAKQYAENPAATTEDVYLRELEIRTLIDVLTEIGTAKGGRVLDVGCGDGYSTVQIARGLLPKYFLGVDYSQNMIALARRRLAAEPDLAGLLEFRVADVMELDRIANTCPFDSVVSDRCLINLSSLEDQVVAIRNIAACLRPSGYWAAIENFHEGQEAMNQARAQLGLPEIPVRWHNCYFHERDFREAVGPYFDEIHFRDFSSSYYLATRVIYSSMCQMRGEAPDYRHEIHQLAVRLPWTGMFSPIRMAIMRRNAPQIV
jgi:SAM-dependent methyltransferase